MRQWREQLWADSQTTRDTGVASYWNFHPSQDPEGIYQGIGTESRRFFFFLQSTFNSALDISPADNQFLALRWDAVIFIEVITASANNFKVCRAGVNRLTWTHTSKNSSDSSGAARSPWVSILHASVFVAATTRRRGHAFQNEQESSRCRRFKLESA